MVQRRFAAAGTVPVAGTGRVDFTGTGNVRAGDDLFICATATDDTVSAVPTFGSDPAGWTKLEDVSGGTRTRFGLWHKTASGSETTVDITATGSGTIAVATACLVLTNGTLHGTRPKGALTTGGAGVAWDTADVTTTVEKSQVYGFVLSKANGPVTPTNCNEVIDSIAGTTATRVAIYERLTKDTGTFDIAGTWGNTTTEAYGIIIMMEPTTSTFSDNFNRTEDPLAYPWEPHVGFTSQEFRADGSVAVPKGGTQSGDVRMDVYERDYQIECTISTKPTTTGDYVSLLTRVVDHMSSSNHDSIELRWTYESAATDTLKLFKWINNSATQIGTTQNLEYASGDKMRLTCIGARYKIEVDQGSGWTTVYEVTDTASQVVRGNVGMRIFGTTGRIDNISGSVPDNDNAQFIHAVTSGGSATAGSTNNITLPIALPGDIYTLNVTTFKTTAGDISVTIPGFTNEGSYINGDHKYFVFTRVCDGSEGNVESATIVKVATASGSFPSATRWRTAGATIIGNPDDIFDVTPFNENEEASSTSWSTDSISVQAKSLLVVMAHVDSTSNITSTTSETDTVETQDAATNSANTALAQYLKPIASAGSEDMTGTFSSAAAHRTFIYAFSGIIPPPTEDSATITLVLTPSGVDEYTGATIYEDSGTILLDLSTSFVEVAETVEVGTILLTLTPELDEEWSGSGTVDADTIYLLLTPSGTEYIHRCRPRFRGTLLTWTYDPDGMYTHWSSVFYGTTWRGELIPVEVVANYAC